MPDYLVQDDIVVINDDVWDAPQRVRHKMALAWARAGNRVLWIEAAPFFNQAARDADRRRRALRRLLEQKDERLWVGTAPLALPMIHRGTFVGNALRGMHGKIFAARIQRYIRELQFKPRFVVLFQSPLRHDLLDHLPHEYSIYYCNDILGYGRGTQAQFHEEQRCCCRVNAVFTTAEPMRDRLAPLNPNTFHIPHAVDWDWWETSRDRVPPEYDRLSAPRAVFTGVCSDRLDVTLIREVARRAPEWQFIFAGPIQRGHESVNAIAEEPNVHVLGRRATDELPGFMAGADVLTFPYRIDELQHYVGLPIKYYEYLASGKPILATPFTSFDGAEAGTITTASTAEDWVAALAAIRANPVSQTEAERRREIARQNTYEARIALQRERLGRALRRR